jgi:hypothetical protein
MVFFTPWIATEKHDDTVHQLEHLLPYGRFGLTATADIGLEVAVVSFCTRKSVE